MVHITGTKCEYSRRWHVYPVKMNRRWLWLGVDGRLLDLEPRDCWWQAEQSLDDVNVSWPYSSSSSSNNTISFINISFISHNIKRRFLTPPITCAPPYSHFKTCRTDGRTDGRTDRQTNGHYWKQYHPHCTADNNKNIIIMLTYYTEWY